MPVSNIIERTVDIDNGIKQEDLHRLFAVADAGAHTFKITVTSKGIPQSLSGHTVIGYFMTNYYGTVVINGSVSNNVATLILPATCYANNTGFQLIIRLVSGSTKTAIYWGTGYVTRSATDPVIDPGSVVPNLDDILAELDQMEQATQAANTAADNANAAASKSIRYDTAQSLTDAQKAQAKSNIGFSVDDTLTETGAAADAKKVGDEIGDLEDDLNDINERIDSIESGLSDDAKMALLACFRHVAFLDDDADYYGVLENALAIGYPRLTVTFLPHDRVFYTDEDVSVLADYLTVRYYQDAEHSAETIAYGNYDIIGSLSQPVNTIAISYAGITSNITVNAIVLRSVVLTDIASYVGYSNISISDGTVTPYSVQTFSVLAYNVPFVRFSFPENQNRVRYVYRKVGDNYYGTDGTTHYLFTKNGSKYDVTNVTETESENIELVGNPYATVRQTAELDINNNVLKVSNENGYIQFNNANTIGYWGANNAVGIAYKFMNAKTYNP